MRLPRQVFFIVSTEACERFSYYGMISILMLYLRDRMQLSEGAAKEIVHLFKMGVYFLPLAGAILADRWLGRYRTILSLSLFYCLGHGVLAFSEGQPVGLALGLGLIAVGAGGIKPCVSAFVGDQFSSSQAGLLPRVYGLFYWAINLGAMFAFGLVPLIRDHAGYRWAFAVPGLLMGVAALCFWLGTPWYVRLPPSIAKSDTAVAAAEPDRWRILGRISLVLLPVPVFWALYDQINTSWVLQGTRMTAFNLLGYKVDAERMQSVSALLVLIWVPLLTYGVYPFLERRGMRLSPLRRMGAGMLFASISFVICAWLEHRLDAGQTLNLGWQVVPYTVLELGEVLLSATGLEFAYSQAPPSMRSIVMSVWLLMTSLGNFLVAFFTHINSQFVHAQGPAEFLFYSGLMLVLAGVFAFLATRYVPTRAPQPLTATQ